MIKKHWWKFLFVAFTIMLGIGVWSNYKNGHLRFSDIPTLIERLGPGDWTRNPSVTEKLSPCVGNTLLTDSPIDIDKVKRLIPLGHIGLPAHLTPMDHMEYVLPEDGQGKTIETDIKAPGAVHIIGVRQSIYKENGAIAMQDYYSIAFTPCKEVLYYFEAMSGLSDSLEKAVEKVKDSAHINSQKQGNREYAFYQYSLDYVAKPGEIIGTAGGSDNISKTLDWGAYDFRIPKLGFLREPEPDPRTSYTTCPIDYFPPSLKEKLYEKFDRTTEPRCGEVMQDKAGTIQGNWKAQAKADKSDQGGWGLVLGIVHFNLDPSIGVIGIGGTISRPGTIHFAPQHSGLVNREPSEVAADGKIYCYFPDRQSPNNWQLSGRVILQLIDAKTLKIEHQEKSCDEGLQFSSPTIYER